MGNPKLEGSNIIDCIPQTGFCPNRCKECYYNNGFFRTLDEPLIPSLEEVGDKIVRINSGHDSNIQKDLVLKETLQYPKKFYNTSIPEFSFPAPVNFTCNGRDTDFSAYMIGSDNLMCARFRVNTWNLDLCDEVVGFYTDHNIPVVLTFMRYRLFENIKRIRDYETKKSIINTYWCIKEASYKSIVNRYWRTRGVFICGTYKSSFCRDCGVCEVLYNKKIG